MTDVGLHSEVMDRLRRYACRAIDAACWPALRWSAETQHRVTPLDHTRPTSWAEVAAEMRRAGWGGSSGYTVHINGELSDIDIDDLRRYMRGQR